MEEVEIYASAELLARAAAERFVALAGKATSRSGAFRVALAGGTTPRRLYALLAEDSYSARVPWDGVHFFWGDERCVPPDHEQSNYRMAREELLDRVPVPADQVHRMRGELQPELAASKYEKLLRQQLSPDGSEKTLGRFDLVLLGMGDDGHTASLFPGTPALAETERWVVGQYVEKLEAWRITLTPPLLNAAHHVLFLVEGQGKAARLHEVLEGESHPDQLPAQLVRPTAGELVWMLDRPAASGLKERGL